MAAISVCHNYNVSPNINDFCRDDLNSCCNVELTEDLWIEIFIRSSVKSLMCLMCVCKHWYALIKQSSFTCRHLQFQKTGSKNNGHSLLYHHNEHTWEINHFLFDGKSTTSSPPLSSHHNTLPSFNSTTSGFMFSIDGPINGLYCLYGENIVILNPAILQVGFVPFPQCLPPNLDDERYLSRQVAGFGVDPLDEENYKIILFSTCLTAFGDDEFDCVMLYTTTTNTWRLLDDDITVRPSLNNTYLNGFYYWKGEGCTAIVFDMGEKEAFRKISMPCHGDLAVHDELLTLFSVDDNLSNIDIWVMLEENNWYKKSSVGGIKQPIMKPLGFCNTENEMFLAVDSDRKSQIICYNTTSQIIRYNTTTQEIRNFGPRVYSGGFKALVYYESLVSLGGGIPKYKGIDCVSFVQVLREFLLEEPPPV